MLKKCHFIGIGGIGMSALARLLLKQGCQVSGSDLTMNYVAEALKRDGAIIDIGHNAENITPDMTVVYATGIKEENPEFSAAQKHGCTLYHRSELLHKLSDGHCALAVAGTHGKTTTSSLMAWVLACCRQSPSYAIGGIIPQLGSNASLGQGKYFVFEACESDGSFRNYYPTGAIVTNIDFDHMEHYLTKEALLNSYGQFMNQVKHPELLFWCREDPYLQQIASKGVSYGFHKECILRGIRFTQKEWSIFFDVSFNGRLYKDIEVALIGRHNALNALAVFGVAMVLGMDEGSVREALKTYAGTLRRCENKGESHEVLFLDDYAHHPTEILATLQGIRHAIGERRLIVAYQPHRYTRAKECYGMYEGAFEYADAVFVTQIYPAGEEPIEEVTSEKVFNDIQKHLPGRCQYILREQCATKIADFLRPHDVFVTLGAGDITKLSHEILNQFEQKPPSKLKVGIIYGGQSVEHEVSSMSAKYISDCLCNNIYEKVNFAITRQGCWTEQERIVAGQEICVPTLNKEKIPSQLLNKLLACDILFPVLHGTYGEDGTIQGFFDILGMAYVGCDHRASAVCMDKALTKKLLIEAGILTPSFVSFSRYDWQKNCDAIIENISSKLVWPVFVKPVHLGSSVGVQKVTEASTLAACIKNAFRFDHRILVENGIIGREIEFAVIGNDEVTVFPPGEICTEGKIYGYQDKYGHEAMKTSIQAELPEELIEKGKNIVKMAYLAAGCQGMARIDTFLDEDGTFWLNEINPIPGCTPNSLYPLICEVNGLPGAKLVDRLIRLGLQRRRNIDKLELKDML